MDAVEAALYNSVEAALTGYFSPQYTMAAARMVLQLTACVMLLMTKACILICSVIQRPVLRLAVFGW